MKLLLSLFAILFGLVTTSIAAEEFIWPPQGGLPEAYGDNPKFEEGSTQTLKWNTDMEEYNINFYQQNLQIRTALISRYPIFGEFASRACLTT